MQSKRKTDGANYPAKRPRRASTVSRHNKKAAPPHSAGHSEIATRQPPSSAEQPMGPVEQQPTLTPDLIDQLVARVADEVTRRLSTANDESTGPITSSVSNQPPIPRGVQVSSVPDAVGQRSIQEPPDAAGSLVEEAVVSSQLSIAGITYNDSLTLPGNNLQSTSMDIDARVPDKLKAKIWNNEFVDFSLLLSNHASNKFQLAVRNLDGSNAPTIYLETINRNQKIVNIGIWLQAFHIFVAVYTRRFPVEAPGLMKYGEIVQDLASRGFNWQFYDENFRFLRQSSASTLPWGGMHWELWLRAQPSPPVFNKRFPPAANHYKPDSASQRVPHGYCFKFHRDLECAGCAFKHACFQCQRDHRVSQCTFRPQGKASGKTSQSPRQPPPHPNKC